MPLSSCPRRWLNPVLERHQRTFLRHRQKARQRQGAISQAWDDGRNGKSEWPVAGGRRFNHVITPH